MAFDDRMFEREKKRSHDVAYLVLLLAILAGTFLVLPMIVNALLGGIPIPKP